MNSHDQRPRPDDVVGANPNGERAAIDGADASRTRSDRPHTAFVDDMADGVAFQSAVRVGTGHIVDFRLDYANQAFCRLVDRARAELAGRRMLELFPAWADGLFDICVQAVETGLPRTGESLPGQRDLEWAKQDGGTSSVEICITRLGDGCAMSLRDVTARRRVEDELFRSQAMLRSVLDTFPERVFWKDRDSVFVGCNAAFARNLNLADPSEIVGKTDFDIHTRSDAEMYRADDHEIMRSGLARIEYEEPRVQTDGTDGWARTSKVPIRDKDGLVIGVLGAYQDISDQKRAQEALRKSEERYRHIIDGITNYIVSVRIANGAPITVNHGPGSVAITGYAPDELDADPQLWSNLVMPEDRVLVDENMRRLLTGVRIAPIEYRIRRKDGVVRWVRETLVLRFDGDGTLTAYDGLVQDITESKILQNQLLQAQKMDGIGRLAGGVAHDFNNLLTAIFGYVELCRADLPPELPPDHPARLDLQEVSAAGERAASLTRQLLTFASRQIVAPVRLDVGSLVQDSLNMLQRLLGDDIEIETSLASDLRTVVADPGQIEQLLVNLTVNARDAMPRGGCLTIELANELIDSETAESQPGAVPGPHVLLAVTDTGEGMTEEVRSRLFEPFFTTKEHGKGTGLGLATCHGIVKQLSGFVEVYSEPHRGTMFRIHLPSQVGPADPRPADPSAPPVSDGTETVLVVEDEPRVRRLAVLGLHARGYTVLEAANGADAIQVALRAGDTIDLIVSDVIMPGMSGPTLIRKLSVLAPRARALLMSGHADSAVLDEASRLHHAFVAKPYTPELLARKVREILDTPRR
jgi:PAS domain S-box-containing protein